MHIHRHRLGGGVVVDTGSQPINAAAFIGLISRQGGVGDACPIHQGPIGHIRTTNHRRPITEQGRVGNGDGGPHGQAGDRGVQEPGAVIRGQLQGRCTTTGFRGNRCQLEIKPGPIGGAGQHIPQVQVKGGGAACVGKHQLVDNLVIQGILKNV